MMYCQVLERRLLMDVTPDRFELNDSFAQATELGALGSRTENGLNLYPAHDQDFFHFSAAASGNINVTINFLNSQGDLDLYLYSQSNAPLASSTGTGNSETINYPVAAGAGYYFVIAGYQGTTNPNYDLVITGPGNDPPPAVSSGSFSYLTSQQIGLVFSEDVLASLDAGDLQVANLTTNTTVDASAFSFSKSNSAGQTTGQWIANSVLADGNYRATLPAAAVADSAGQNMDSPYTLDFFFLGADANRDRKVDLTDFTVLASNFNGTGKNFSQGNFSYDAGGVVDLTDFTILAGKFNSTLPASPSSASAASLPAPVAPAPIDKPVPQVFDDHLISDVIPGLADDVV